MAHVLIAIPTYNNDGQEFVEHRAFILHVIFKEDIFIIQQPTEFLREKVTAKEWLLHASRKMHDLKRFELQPRFPQAKMHVNNDERIQGNLGRMDSVAGQ
ncbi:hypothetical protein PAL_GLEAN10020203 [Pteropus alecto]|uniref:Uncharacterized protein n=1 Tax=Pteropus alecto TaxID=9402 RepID=L5KRF1_PTEAL|nr:hypothetical protein PAL_GLEAN10020203 [Pteropus alecto]